MCVRSRVPSICVDSIIVLFGTGIGPFRVIIALDRDTYADLVVSQLFMPLLGDGNYIKFWVDD